LRGDTALIIAATDGYDSIVKLLLEAGADKVTVNEVHSMKNQNTQI
jgi:ankyrin repeat protein